MIFQSALGTMLGQLFSSFKCCKVSGIEGNDFRIGLRIFEAIFELLGPKYTQTSTLLSKFVPVI